MNPLTPRVSSSVSNTPKKPELVPLTRATEDWADAQLEAEFARLNPEIQRRVALRVLEVDAWKREAERLRQALTRIAYVDPPDATWDGSPSEALEWAGKIAREALR